MVTFHNLPSCILGLYLNICILYCIEFGNKHMCSCLELPGQICLVALQILFTIYIITFDFLIVAILLFHVINISGEANV